MITMITRERCLRVSPLPNKIKRIRKYVFRLLLQKEESVLTLRVRGFKRWYTNWMHKMIYQKAHAPLFAKSGVLTKSMIKVKLVKEDATVEQTVIQKDWP